jgi:alcohol dehydrogenase class IV
MASIIPIRQWSAVAISTTCGRAVNVTRRVVVDERKTAEYFGR